ncbi:hypothetical protein GHK86_05335 [Acidimicrobiaceae bacterium USS-CC1]|uniref:Uncharacterized protein n=1 Tax=Acidiferrimicrobium australe TaxID=2664430 RepID=A0ABW9QR19_9ACTN|nr:hypothetical protein [Acidiferrimicrobium australe]
MTADGPDEARVEPACGHGALRTGQPGDPAALAVPTGTVSPVAASATARRTADGRR